MTNPSQRIQLLQNQSLASMQSTSIPSTTTNYPSIQPPPPVQPYQPMYTQQQPLPQQYFIPQPQPIPQPYYYQQPPQQYYQPQQPVQQQPSTPQPQNSSFHTTKTADFNSQSSSNNSVSNTRHTIRRLCTHIADTFTYSVSSTDQFVFFLFLCFFEYVFPNTLTGWLMIFLDTHTIFRPLILFSVGLLLYEMFYVLMNIRHTPRHSSRL